MPSCNLIKITTSGHSKKASSSAAKSKDIKKRKEKKSRKTSKQSSAQHSNEESQTFDCTTSQECHQTDAKNEENSL